MGRSRGEPFTTIPNNSPKTKIPGIFAIPGINGGCKKIF
jgi:hypothetical protein